MNAARRWLLASCLLAAGVVRGQEAPFSAAAFLRRTDGGGREVVVTLHVSEHHYLYADQVSVAAVGGARLVPVTIPDPREKEDPFLAETVRVYDRDVTLVHALQDAGRGPLEVEVRYQGCSETMCFPPATRRFTLDADDASAPSAGLPRADASQAASVSGWRARAERFSVAGRAAGYLKPDEFLAFLDRAESGADAPADSVRSAFERHGLWLAALLILLGGLALNLTPCVLPMIPINIAIIGAGAQASSRRRGFALGGAYGLGIALVYGVLGLAVILSGSRFGALNSSPWFNLGVAAVFGLLSFAMFDVFALDLSRFQKGGSGENRRGTFLTAAFLGGGAALLAGACVAPVVISVLLLSADQYARGRAAGLLLPFLLGLGMALPWPLVGAGLSFLPRPGKWMNRVKTAFGIVILLFAAWYARLGISLLAARSAESGEAAAAAQQAPAGEGAWFSSPEAALRAAEQEHKSVFIDFWATWCKNCLKMEKTTFRNEAVRRRLEDYVKLKFQAENMADPDVKAGLDPFGVIGLPTYIVLVPEAE